MASRRLVVKVADAALLLAASLLVACSPGTAGLPAISPSASAKSSPTQQAVLSPDPSATGQSTPAGTSIGRCATGWLQMSLGITQGAAGNERTIVTMVNRSGSTCYLGGYPGVEMVDANGKNLGDAQWSTDSFFGTYAAPHGVEISAGGSTFFELTYGGSDPCGTIPARHPASLKITPPGAYDSATISANPNPGTMTVCANYFQVHPVGSGLQTR
jgi:uncharacterized protein DUF4232